MHRQNESINEFNCALFILAHHSVSWHFRALNAEWWMLLILHYPSESQAVNKNYERHNMVPKSQSIHSYIHSFGFADSYKQISVVLSQWQLMMIKGLPESFKSLHSFWSYFLILWKLKMVCAVLTIMHPK